MSTAGPIRLLVTTSDFVGRGSERELSNLLAWLPRDRFEISLCVWRDVFEYPCPSDVPVTVLHKTRPWHILRTIRRLALHIEQTQPDVLLSQLNYVNTATGSALGLCRHRPAWLPRFAGNPEVEIRWPILPWTRRALRRASVVAGCTPAVTQSIRRHLHVPAERTITLPNLIDVNAILAASKQSPRLTKPAGKRVILTAGGLVHQKNHELVIRTLATLERNDIELWIVGKGPLEGRLRQQARELQVESRIRWLGFDPGWHSLLPQADLFVLCSRYEGLPNALIEAMLVATPVVSTDCPFGPADLIDPPRTGWLTPVGEIEPLAKAIRHALDHPDEARQRGILAQATIRERLDPGRIVTDYADQLERLARESAQGRSAP